MNLYEDQLFNLFVKNRGIKKSTADRYNNQLKLYCEFLNKTPTQLIEEGGEQSDKNIRKWKLNIKVILLDFKKWLEDNDYSPTTITTTITTIRSFYTEFDIELGKMNLKNLVNDENIEDIPSKEDIRKALGYANIRGKAIIYLLSSSGMGSAEVRTLTYQQFLKSISEYVEIDVNEWIDIKELVKKLQENDSMKIPFFNIRRIKTGLRMMTFCTPESLNAIIEYLETHPPQHLEDPLFRTKDEKPLTETLLAKYFQKLNSKCRFGTTKRGQVFFKSHAVGRKYFATTLTNKVGLQYMTIQFYLGRSLGKTDTPYFKADPDFLKEQYMLCIEELSINEFHVETLQSDEKKELIALKDEMEQIKSENVEQLEKLQRELEAIRYLQKQ